MGAALTKEKSGENFTAFWFYSEFGGDYNVATQQKAQQKE